MLEINELTIGLEMKREIEIERDRDKGKDVSNNLLEFYWLAIKKR